MMPGPNCEGSEATFFGSKKGPSDPEHFDLLTNIEICKDHVKNKFWREKFVKNTDCPHIRFFLPRITIYNCENESEIQLAICTKQKIPI